MQRNLVFSEGVNVSRERLSIPSPDVSRDGGAHVLVSNFGLIARALRREPDHIHSYLLKEGGLQSNLIGGRSSPATLML